MAGTKTPQRDLFAEMRDEVADELQGCEDLVRKMIERHDIGCSGHLEVRKAVLPLYVALLNILRSQGHLSPLDVQHLQQTAAKHMR